MVPTPDGLDINTLTKMKNFVADRPEYALLAFSMCFNIVLFAMLMRAKNALVSQLERWLPIVERLSRIVERFKPRRPVALVEEELEEVSTDDPPGK